MSFLKNLESKLEQLIEGGFKAAFKSEVQPIEIARKLVREMDGNRTTSVSRTYAPNEFTIFLSPPDREQFAHYEEGLKRELSGHLLEHARKRGYSLISRPTVEIETEERLELGMFGIQSRLADAPPGEADIGDFSSPHGHTMVYNARDLDAPAIDLPPPVVAQHAVLEVNGRRYAISPPATVVGRGSEADIKVDDPNVSRRHARFFLSAGHWSVEDLGSTNGTSVGGNLIGGPASLAHGDVVQIGNTTLTFVLE